MAETFKSNTFTTTTSSFTKGGSVTVQDDAYIIVSGGVGIALDQAVWSVKVDGVLQSSSNGIHFASNLFGVKAIGPLTLTVGTEGFIRATDVGSSGVFLGHPVNVTNSGVIVGEGFGINAQLFGPTTAKGFTITNKAGGGIGANDVGIYNGNAGALLTIKNAGTLAGDKAVQFDGALNLTNDYLIVGDVEALSPSGFPALTITNNAKGILSGTISLANGNDTVTNKGQIDNTITLRNGDNKMTNSGILGSALSAGNGNDVMTNSGEVRNDVDLGDGNNKLTNSGEIDGAVTFGIGNDTLSNTGTITGIIDMGKGSNSFTNSADSITTINFGTGNDIVKNSGHIDFLNLGDGENNLTNSGTISAITFGTGGDIFKNTGEVLGAVDLGGGNDTFTGGSLHDAIRDSTGDDKYSMGGGDDAVYLVTGNDTLDGGAGNDTVRLWDTNSVSPCSINLDTKAVILNGQVLAASSFISAGPGINASLKSFENAQGSDGADLINGTAAANEFLGLDGNDFIAGGLGADGISGGDGSDTFVYFTIKDSGVTKATRDVISDFGGGDAIDLRAIDANSKLPTDQSFSLLAHNQPFVLGTLGQVRTVTQLQDTIVQIDLNGDTKVDMEIELTGIHSLNSTTILL